MMHFGLNLKVPGIPTGNTLKRRSLIYGLFSYRCQLLVLYYKFSIAYLQSCCLVSYNYASFLFSFLMLSSTFSSVFLSSADVASSRRIIEHCLLTLLQLQDAVPDLLRFQDLFHRLLYLIRQVVFQ